MKLECVALEIKVLLKCSTSPTDSSLFRFRFNFLRKNNYVYLTSSMGFRGVFPSHVLATSTWVSEMADPWQLYTQIVRVVLSKKSGGRTNVDAHTLALAHAHTHAHPRAHDHAQFIFALTCTPT